MTSIQKLKRAFESGFTVYAAAQFAGVSADDASLFYDEETKRRGGVAPKVEKTKARGRSMDPAEIARVRKMRAEGLSYRDIQKETGFAYATISRYCNGKYYKSPPVEAPPQDEVPAPIETPPPEVKPVDHWASSTITTLEGLIRELKEKKRDLEQSIEVLGKAIKILQEP